MHGDIEQECGRRSRREQVGKWHWERGRDSVLIERCVRIFPSLVIGTENRRVLVLDPPGNTILANVKLPGVPVNLGITGLHDVDYRIVVACRDGKIYTIKVSDAACKETGVTALTGTCVTEWRAGVHHHRVGNPARWSCAH